MNKVKTMVIDVIILLLIIVISFCIFTGLRIRIDVGMVGFEVYEEKQEILIKVTVMSSMGYIRDIRVKRAVDDTNGLCVDFYSTFGGLNSNLGARNDFRIKLKDTDSKIYFGRGNSEYELVISKDSVENKWIAVR